MPAKKIVTKVKAIEPVKKPRKKKTVPIDFIYDTEWPDTAWPSCTTAAKKSKVTLCNVLLSISIAVCSFGIVLYLLK